MTMEPEDIEPSEDVVTQDRSSLIRDIFGYTPADIEKGTIDWTSPEVVQDGTE